jgi:hypothetical protein
MTDMGNRPETPHEDKERRCPKLGGPVSFSYCRVESQGKPCSRSIQCWSRIFDVESYFRINMDDQEFCECFKDQGRPKLVTLVDLIEQARQRLKDSGDQSGTEE